MIENFSRPTVANLDLSALEHNFNELKSLSSSNSLFCPMVKANAYGHGDIEVSTCLQELGVESLGVATVEEGVRLRKSGIHKPQILVFGFFNQASAQCFLEHRLTPVISSMEQLQILKNAATNKSTLGVHLKFNTGMFRLGFRDRSMDELKSELSGFSGAVEGICTHLANAEDFFSREPTALAQVRNFEQIVEHFPGVNNRHVYNSLGLMAMAFSSGGKVPEYGVRPGIAIYGIKQSFDTLPDSVRGKWDNLTLKPVMSWKTGIAMTQNLKNGDHVSYGWTWKATRPSTIAILPCGYGDGLPRLLSNRAQVLYRGKKVPVVGTVCMDYTLIDVTDVCQEERPKIGEEVVIIGHQGENNIDAEDVAKWAETISYEIFTGLSSRVPKIYN